MPAGRPTKYKPEYVAQAAKLCALGATDAQLADFFEVSVSTIALWKVQHKEFSDAIKVPKAEADERVEQSLYRRAMGYEHDEVDIRVVGGEIVQTPIRKFYPPDTAAAIFWLKNRAGWRDGVTLSGDPAAPLNTGVTPEIIGAMAKLSPEQLRALAAKNLKGE
jgi:hypothetical protein